MPELPEVETIAQQLRAGRSDGTPPLIGRTIVRARALWAREIDGMSARAFERQTRNRAVTSIGRHGKYLIIGLGEAGAAAPLSMLVPLRMSGRLDVVAQVDAGTKHARVVWELDGGWALRFDDARKFGRVYLVADPAQVTGRTGPDALQISAGEFSERLSHRRGALKSILLDQAFIAGVGNIYADESLFLAGLRPKRLAQTLGDADRLRLHAAVRQTLLDGVAANGASFDWVYPGGNYQDNFRVYGRTGRACVTCGRPIQRIIVGQRSTHYCAHCQK